MGGLGRRRPGFAVSCRFALGVLDAVDVRYARQCGVSGRDARSRLPVEDNNAAVFRYGTHMLVTLHTSETETIAPLATEIYGLDGALVQVRGDHPSSGADFGDAGTLMVYSNAVGVWKPIEGISREFQPKGSSSAQRFFDALSAGQPMPISMYDGRRCVQILAAGELASQEKRQVDIAEIS